MNTRNKISLLFHSGTLVHHIVAAYNMMTVDFDKSPDPMGKQLVDYGPRYFTTWSLAIQILYLSLALFVDLSHLLLDNKNVQHYKTMVQKYKGYLFNIFMFPSTLYVSIFFWTLVTINRDWVFPESMDVVVPKLLNHAVHTHIVFVLLGELLLIQGDLPRPSFKIALRALNVFSLLYYTQYIITYFQHGIWLYRIFYDLSWMQRLLFIMGTHTTGIGFMKLGYFIQSYKSKMVEKVA